MVGQASSYRSGAEVSILNSCARGQQLFGDQWWRCYPPVAEKPEIVVVARVGHICAVMLSLSNMSLGVEVVSNVGASDVASCGGIEVICIRALLHPRRRLALVEAA